MKMRSRTARRRHEYGPVSSSSGLVSLVLCNNNGKSISALAAMISTRSNYLSIVEWWIAQQPSKEAALVELNDDQNFLPNLFRECDTNTLDWWWAHSSSKLPKPEFFAYPVDTVLASHSLEVVEWLWSQFLEYCTPGHTFGKYPCSITAFDSVNLLDWYWQHFQAPKELFPHSDSELHGISFKIDNRTTLPILQWAVNKCAELGDQKLTLAERFINLCRFFGDADLLDLLLHSKDLLI
ncbi:hypothetical protein BC828DRAFT_437520, partial [Blastocladiella britannica]